MYKDEWDGRDWGWEDDGDFEVLQVGAGSLLAW